MKDTENRTNIYLYRKDDYESEKKRIASWKTSDKNKEIITNYYMSMMAKGATSKRICKLGVQVRIMINILGKDVDTTTKRDIERLIVEISQRKEVSDATKSDYRRIVKSFYKWFKKEDNRLKSEDKALRDEALDLYEYTAEIKRSEKRKKIDYSNILNEEDCRILIDKGCNRVQEKAIVSILHETGCRIGEFLSMRIKSIEFKEDYAMIQVDGKTGERRIPIIQSIPYLRKWLDEHPDKNNKNSLVWIITDNRFRNKPYHWVGIIRMLRRIKKRAGIDKKCNPHWFRHSRATILVDEGYQEEIIRNIMGWTSGSDEIKTYIHIGAKQVENAFKHSNGLESVEEYKPKFRKCVCDTINDSTAKYCYKCGKALSIGTFLQDEKDKNIQINSTLQWFMSEVMNNPEMMQKYNEFKKLEGNKNE